MIIYITRSVRIACEGDGNVTIQAKHTTQKGAVSWVNRGYYARIGDAAEGIVRKGLSDAEGTATLEKAAARIEEACRFVRGRVDMGLQATEENAPDREVVQ